MSLPVIENALILDGPTRSQLEGIVATLQAWMLREHKGDGTHDRITATSLSVTDGIQERGRRLPIGVWADVPYVATDFTGSGAMTWTVDAADVQLRRFAAIGQTLFYNIALAATSVGGVVSNELRMALPPSYVVARTVNSVCFMNDAGTGNVGGLATSVVGDTFVRFQRATGANWLVSANATAIYATLSIEVR